MKNIFKIFSSENLKNNLKKVYERFPITLIIIFLIAGLFFTEIHYNNEISDFYNNRIAIIIATLIMIFVFSIWAYLFSENSNKTRLERNIFQIIPIGFWILFYSIFSIDITSFENSLFFWLSFTWIISLLFFAPYIKNIFTKWVNQSVRMS